MRVRYAKGGRLVSNLADIAVVTVPEPATAPMLVPGLAMVWQWRRKAVVRPVPTARS